VSALVLGPLLRWVGQRSATVWVETGAPCTVELTITEPGGGSSTFAERTFQVRGHHYALLVAEGLSPGQTYPFTVALDHERVWPPPDSPFPPSVLRTPLPAAALRFAFGSCRQPVPHEPPWTLPTRADRKGHGVDALVAYARRMLGEPRLEWPDTLLLLGDQLYADDTPPAMREYIAARRDPRTGPRWGLKDFEEYTYLYRLAWQVPIVRWLLSTVPSAMIFDDHDVHDDWNTSEAWVAKMRAKPWWHERIVGALMSYWLYQHIGNLAPDDLADDALFNELKATSGDGGPALEAYAERADREPGPQPTRWSYRREYGATRLVVIDTRGARVLEGGRRDMLDPAEWDWLDRHLTGDIDHLLIATSLPFLLPPAVHDMEAWNEALCAGAWGRPVAWLSEQARQLGDLEHWAAFRTSFERLAGMIAEVAAGERGAAPATITLLSGDVHHAYLAAAEYPPERGVTSRVWQAVCSPLRNPANRGLELANRAANTRLAARVWRRLAATARVPAPPLDWRLTRGPFFDNQIATVELAGRSARLRLERPRTGDAQGTEADEGIMDTVLDEPLAPDDRAHEPA